MVQNRGFISMWIFFKYKILNGNEKENEEGNGDKEKKKKKRMINGG